MKLKSFISLGIVGLKTIVFKVKKPFIATIILTDYCNLSCRHCKVNNINKIIYPYQDIRREIQSLYKSGNRILFFYGGETLMWEDNGKTITDLIKEAKQIGFLLVNIVTNGTITLDIPEADVIFLSIDGTRENHNFLRGNTYDKVLNNISKANNSNICVYMTINNVNYKDIIAMGELVRTTPNLKSISFNFHTPYEGTEQLELTSEQKQLAITSIKSLKKAKYPIFNLTSALDYFQQNNWQRPSYLCVVSENNKRYTCGRCIEIDGLCDKCGYLFAVEFSLICKGKIKVIFDMVRTYLKYV